MRLLHTSDWHLGKSLSSHPLEEDQEFALAQICAQILDQAYDAVIISGDIFDRSTPSDAAVRTLGRWLGDVHAAKPRLPIIIIAGNHDNGPRLAWTASILDHQQVYLRGDTQRIGEPIVIRAASGTDAQVWAVPFLLSGAMGESSRSQEEAMREAVAHISSRQDRALAQVAVAHCFVSNGQTSDSERTLIGTASQIEAEQFAGFDYAALGHLHRPQQVAPNARYAGSIARYSFSEANHSKAMLDIVVEPGAPHTCTPVPLKTLRAMHRVSGTLDALLSDPAFADKRSGYVEITLNPPVYVGNPLEELRAHWPHVLKLLNEQPSQVGSLVTVQGGDVDGPRDLEQDFLDFDRNFPASDTQPDAILAAFRTLLSKLPEDVQA